MNNVKAKAAELKKVQSLLQALAIACPGQQTLRVSGFFTAPAVSGSYWMSLVLLFLVSNRQFARSLGPTLTIRMERISCSVCDRLWFTRGPVSLPAARHEVLRSSYPDSELTAFKLCAACLHSVCVGNILTLATCYEYAYPPTSEG